MPNDSQQIMLPKWAADVLLFAAGICLIVSLCLAIANRVEAGTLAAGLFVVCVLFHYPPQMQSFKAWGIEATWRAIKSQENIVRQADAAVEQATKELDAKISEEASPEELAVTVAKVRAAITRLSTANTALSATISAVGSTIRPDGKPPFSTTSKSE